MLTSRRLIKGPTAPAVGLLAQTGMQCTSGSYLHQGSGQSVDLLAAAATGMLPFCPQWCLRQTSLASVTYICVWAPRFV